MLWVGLVALLVVGGRATVHCTIDEGVSVGFSSPPPHSHPIPPTSTLCPLSEAELAIVNNSLACTPVDCAVVYGALRPIFDPQTKLCVSRPSPSPSPSVGASPSNSPLTSHGGGGILNCMHGAVVCVATCSCNCNAGWHTEVTDASVFSLVYWRV